MRERITLENTLPPIEDGWMQISPYGDFDHSRGKQRVTKSAADQMVSNFNSIWGKLKRWFTGLPLYVGHPDLSNLANEYTDKSVYGVFTELQARDNGLYGRVVLTPEGSQVVSEYRSVSPHWLADSIEENGSKFFIPQEMVSVGLTNRPNLPVRDLANETTAESGADNPVCPSQTMDKSKLIALLGLAAEATDQQVMDAVTVLKTGGGQAVVLENARRAAEVALTNERAARIEEILNRALETGRITPAERPAWATALANSAEFASKSTELEQKPLTLKVTPQAADLGARRIAVANGRAETATRLVEEYRLAHNCNFQTAWEAVKGKQPDLFKN